MEPSAQMGAKAILGTRTADLCYEVGRYMAPSGVSALGVAPVSASAKPSVNRMMRGLLQGFLPLLTRGKSPSCPAFAPWGGGGSRFHFSAPIVRNRESNPIGFRFSAQGKFCALPEGDASSQAPNPFQPSCWSKAWADKPWAPRRALGWPPAGRCEAGVGFRPDLRCQRRAHWRGA